jgi:cytochrome c oxidase cbb3-type subunit 3
MSPSRRAAILLIAFLGVAAVLAACDPLASRRSPGERLFREHCAKCHGIDGAGNTPAYMGNAYADLTDSIWKYGGNQGAIASTVRKGVFGEMPPFRQLSDEEVNELALYVLGLRGTAR